MQYHQREARWRFDDILKEGMEHQRKDCQTISEEDSFENGQEAILNLGSGIDFVPFHVGEFRY